MLCDPIADGVDMTGIPSNLDSYCLQAVHGQLCELSDVIVISIIV